MCWGSFRPWGSSFVWRQTFTLQEMPERAPLGQLPRSVDVVMDNDLVDKAKPGDRVQVVGVYRALAGQGANVTSGVFRTVLIANSVRLLNKDSETAPLSADDVTVIRKIGKRADVVGACVVVVVVSHDCAVISARLCP